MSWRASWAVGAITALVLFDGCKRSAPHRSQPSFATAGGLVSAPAATAAGSSRAGMVWVPAGAFRAGTPRNRTPRIAEEELPGMEVTLGGFYIDVLPYPNESGAIPTSNVSRDEAARLCETKSKRLCTELEWERACKGPEDTTYEYGDVYRAAACDTGVAAEQSAMRPSGDRQGCKSGFGVREMHGGPWEWTDATWGRGSTKDLGVLRGGNALAGELVGRCANGLARPPTSKSSSMGFRCCAGPKNEAQVHLALVSGPALERSMKTADVTSPLLPLAMKAWPAEATEDAFLFVHAWTWRPVPNEQLVIGTGCARGTPRPRCGLVVARNGSEDAGETAPAGIELWHVETGFEAAEVAEVGDARHLRLKGLDATSGYLRDFTYAYGRVEAGEVKR